MSDDEERMSVGSKSNIRVSISVTVLFLSDILYCGSECMVNVHVSVLSKGYKTDQIVLHSDDGFVCLGSWIWMRRVLMSG